MDILYTECASGFKILLNIVSVKTRTLSLIKTASVKFTEQTLVEVAVVSAGEIKVQAYSD